MRQGATQAGDETHKPDIQFIAAYQRKARPREAYAESGAQPNIFLFSGKKKAARRQLYIFTFRDYT
jgi:hypothetical protein